MLKHVGQQGIHSMVHATPRFAETASFDDTFHHMFLFLMDGYWASGRYYMYNLTLYTSEHNFLAYNFATKTFLAHLSRRLTR